MLNKCGVNCKGNYNELNKWRVFKLSNDEVEKQKWIDLLPPPKNVIMEPSKFFICERHWPRNTVMIKFQVT